jgi:type IV pilus biogenesis protein PilP
MRAASRLILVSVLAAGAAQGETVSMSDPHAGPSAMTGTVTPTASPPAPPSLAPPSPDFQAAMANSQLATYRYNQLTEQALALKKLCETGFGPADICPKATVGVTGTIAASAPADLPTVAEISGSGSGLTAVLALPDGRRIGVHAGSVLPDGRRIAAISNDDVWIVREGGDIALSFAGADPK